MDLSWALIYGMERVGLVWDVKVPTEERQELRKAKGEAAPGGAASADPA